MVLLISKIISSILQIALFTAIPFIWWFVTAKKQQKFTDWIGLKTPDGGKKTLVATAIVSVAFLFLGILTLYITKDVETSVSEFFGLGIKAIPAIMIYAAFNTAFPEELLFRGFLLKRLAIKTNFNAANFVQALLFGLMHGIMFFSLTGTAKTILIILFTSAVAWFMGYINEKVSNGSFLPSWIIHTVSNLFSGICSAFSVL